MTKKSKLLLIEAMRRWFMLHPNFDKPTRDQLTAEWTGLGTTIDYAPAVKNGLMQPVRSTSGCVADIWWRLTDKGAGIIQDWLSKGIVPGDFKGFDLPFDPDGEIPCHCAEMPCQHVRDKIRAIIDDYIDNANWRDPYDPYSAIMNYREKLVDNILNVFGENGNV
ncbi:MAG: hypothetical protein WC390_10320 [Sulfurimonas sp.]|jgi:hypothetical protein